ncbi:hypothetical protein [Chitinophaga sp. S165]|uniref:hypothetical protein n=1 Tax=Chitinophaga sp. S165 TaxID=2135462 RepID=UPI000D715900|nr:hypothetical protein [Chitinophaga sp. S165]PWV46212.1 hypothetical protein C7475_111115 [Chitinophaga sp. S165]
MRKKVLVVVLFIGVLATAVFVACNKKDSISKEAAQPQKFPDVQAWFMQTITTEYAATEAKVMSGEIPGKKLQWNDGITYQKDSTIVYQIPFFSKGLRAYEISDTNAKARLPLNILDKVGYRYVVFNKYRTGVTSFALMTIKGDKSYLQRHNHSLEGVNYRSVTADFSGYILFHTWDEHFIIGWRYQNGRPVSGIYPTTFQVSGRIVDNNNVAADESCRTYVLDQWCQDCTDYYTNGEYTHTVCQPAFICGSEVVTTCSEVGPPPSGGSGSYPSYSLGNGDPVLCPQIFAMKLVGNSYTGAIRGLGVSFLPDNGGGSPLLFNWQKFCVTIPKYGIGPEAASEIFREAYNKACKQTELALEAGMPPQGAKTALYFKETLLTNLKKHNVAATFSEGEATCSGNIPVTTAKYGPNCQ